MAQEIEIDWINSQAEMCKVNLYSPDEQKDQERKMICFVDVANLNRKDSNLDPNIATDQPDNTTDPASELDLRNLEEKEIIVIKDDEKSRYLNTEGAVCLFKQGSLDDVNVVHLLNNDLQKYAFGFQQALAPLRTYRKLQVFDKGSQNNNNTGPISLGTETGNPDELAYYADKLCSLVVEIARKEIKERWDKSGRCLRQNIVSLLQGNKSAMEENDGKEPDALYSNKVKITDDCTSLNKGMMVYANQVASDMMLSFLKTMNVKGRHAPPACGVFKEVLVRHAKEIVSDLIDSSMKNLHNITGALMTDSDFICGLKRNLYSMGSQKSSEILEAMVKRLFKLLSGDDKTRSQSLAFTTYKVGNQGCQRTQGMQFASLKSESHSQKREMACGPGKILPSGSRGSKKQGSSDVYAKEILLTALMQIQRYLLEKTKDARHHETSTSSFSYCHDSPYDRSGERSHSYSPKYSSKSCDKRTEYYCSDSLKDKGGLLLSVIQKILQEAGLNFDDICLDKYRG